MAGSTTYTAADIAAIEAALAQGVLRVTHNGVMTEYRSRAEMVAQVKMMRRYLGMPDPDQDAQPTRIRRLRFNMSKGLGF